MDSAIIAALTHFASWEALKQSAAASDSDAETVAMLTWGSLTMAGIKTDRVHTCAGGWHFEVPIEDGAKPLNVFIVPDPEDVFAWIAGLMHGDDTDTGDAETRDAETRDAEPLNDNDPTITRSYN